MTRAAWEAAALRLFDDKYSLVATGPRAHADWRLDALAVMNRDVTDPRGWAVLDRDRDNAEERARHGRAFPFDHPTVESLNSSLHQFEPGTAAPLLVALTDDWCQLRNAPGFPEEQERLFEDARTLLVRYQEPFECYTNLDRVERNTATDAAGRSFSWSSLTQYTADYGLIVVSDTELGLFWSFDPV
ncbi:hypothetical protein ABZ208_08590 [Streptomyces sp. NPDC006208]|uniref:hypothetical protein n=1 Tax=Streptomyces sp. NPDC006208 TaxID=3156734 RepID=UPI0033A1951C